MDDTEYGRIIAMNLKRLAYEHGKNQTQMARDLNVSKTTLSSWMSGYRVPRMKKIDMLAQYFNCKRTDIIEPYVPKPLESISAFERNMILAYRVAPDSIKDSVLILLGMKERE